MPAKMKTKAEKLLWIVFGIIVVVSIWRCFFGIEKSDEAYYVADAITALHGNYTFAYNFSHAAGMVFVILLFLGLLNFYIRDIHSIDKKIGKKALKTKKQGKNRVRGDVL